MESFENIDNLESQQEVQNNLQQEHDSESKLKRIAIGAFAVFMFFFFLLMKLPEARISNYLLAHIRIIAQEQGFSFTAEKVRLGIILGPSLKIYNVELKSLEDEHEVVKIPFIKLKPKIFSLLSKTKKANVSIEMGEGEINGAVGGSMSGIYLDLDLDKVNLAQAPILKKYTMIEMASKISGSVYLDMNTELPQMSQGKFKLKLIDTVLPSQSFMGFNLPKIQIKESKMEIEINQGKIQIQNLTMGTSLKNDDITAKVTGDGVLAKYLDQSKMNGSITFELSRNVINSFPILESLLAPAKTTDGKYNYRFSGPLGSLDVRPGT